MKVWTLADAASQAVARSRDPGGSWMTPDQFAQWCERFFPSGRQIGDAMERAIGVPKRAAKMRRDGLIVISKTEALACAHYAMGFPVPTPPGNTEAFAEWLASRFVAANAVNGWLELSGGYVANRVRGFVLRDGVRHPAPADVGMIRALDWVYRVGPVVPWIEGRSP